MQLPKGATVAVADGQKFHLFRNAGDQSHPDLKPVKHDKVDAHKRADAGHHSSSANPDDRQVEEDGFSTGTIGYLNSKVLDGTINALLVIASPKSLGDMRKRYHERLSAVLLGEIDKDLTGRSVHEIEKAIAAA